MSSPQYTLETFIYSRTDAELIFAAGEIIGTHQLNLSLETAVAVIRENWSQG